MTTDVPPPLFPEAAQKIRRLRRMLVVLFVLYCVLVLVGIVIPVLKGASLFAGFLRGASLNFKSYRDKFQVEVLEVKSGPGYFRERVRVRCEKDMNAGLWVTDFKKAGFFSTREPNGEVVYREGEPHVIGQAVPVAAEGRFSTCEFSFSVTTAATNTVWHSEQAGSTLDTTLEAPMSVSLVQTNWSGSYERGTSIPLARLGDYQVLLSIK